MARFFGRWADHSRWIGTTLPVSTLLSAFQDGRLAMASMEIYTTRIVANPVHYGVAERCKMASTGLSLFPWVLWRYFLSGRMSGG